jgi:hypothetical protein
MIYLYLAILACCTPLMPLVYLAIAWEPKRKPTPSAEVLNNLLDLDEHEQKIS